MIKEVEARAPGKAILHGEHTVVYGTKAIAIAVGLHTTVRIRRQSNPEEVHVTFNEVGLSQVLLLDELKALKASLGNFSFQTVDNPEAVIIDQDVSKLLEDFVALKNGFTGTLRSAFEATFKAFLFIYLAAFDDLEPITLTAETELPVGGGLGSSSSFAVALAGALLAAAGRIKPEKVDTDIVNRWAFVSEKFVHGNPSGIDNAVATLGGAVVYQKGQPLVPLKCSNISVLLVSTEVPRSTKELVARVATLKETNPSLHSKYMNEGNSIVEKAITELERTGIIKSEYIEENQALLRNLNVSHPRLDTIVETAKRNGMSAKLTGAGGGGCAFVVIPPNTSKEAVDKLQLDLKSECNEFKFWSVPLGVSGINIKTT